MQGQKKRIYSISVREKNGKFCIIRENNPYFLFIKRNGKLMLARIWKDLLLYYYKYYFSANHEVIIISSSEGIYCLCFCDNTKTVISSSGLWNKLTARQQNNCSLSYFLVNWHTHGSLPLSMDVIMAERTVNDWQEKIKQQFTLNLLS